MRLYIVLVCAFQALSFCASRPAAPSFVVDYENNRFLKDGQPFRYISGSFHYPRVPSVYWKDRMMKMKAMGLNTISTYVPWNFHQPYFSEKSSRFTGDQDLGKFLDTAHEVGMLVLLRAGPYICGEWENGGFPAWITANSSMKIRTSEPGYLAAVTTWMNTLMPIVKPRLYANGGAVIMVQVENEYGSYPACDHDYINYLYNLYRKLLGDDVILYSTDGPSTRMVSCGSSKEIFTTVDFGAGGDPNGPFSVLRQYQAKGPLVNSEFYTGWLDHWGSGHAHVSTDAIVATLKKMLAMEEVSVNMYMAEGGTNFAFWNGANSPAYAPQPTSYDYDAPITESGRYHPDKYMAIRSTISTAMNVTLPPVPELQPTKAYGTVKFTHECSLGSILGKVITAADFPTPQPFGAVHQSFGFMLYENTFTVHSAADTGAASSLVLTVAGMLHDRTVLLINDVRQGTLNRQDSGSQNISVAMPSGSSFQLGLLVENQGRINYGGQMGDHKGFTGTVTSSSATAGKTWYQYALSLDDTMTSIYDFPKQPIGNAHSPAFFYGTFQVDAPADTFLYTPTLGKGQLFVNDYNVGRYWPTAGPQKALYVPGSFLTAGQNNIAIFELDNPVNGSTEVEFKDVPDVGLGNRVEVKSFERS